MIDDSDEIRWLKDRQPQVDPPSAEATGWARASLLFRAEQSPGLVCLDSECEQKPVHSARRWIGGMTRRSRRGVAAAVAVAVVAVAAIAAAAIGFPQSDSSLLGPAPASAAITSLADKVEAAPLTGDATLVRHTNAITDAKGSTQSFGGTDLYLDDGRYFYAETTEGLPDAVKGGPIDYSLKAPIDAMNENATAGAQVARAAYLKAVNPQWGDDTERAPTWKQDNVIWCSGIDVLGAAYGRPQVLAAMLRVFSTVDGVSVKHTTFDGHDALQISMKDPGSKAWAKIIAASPEPMSSGAAASLAEMKSRKKEAVAKAGGKFQPVPPHLMTLTLDDQTGALLHYSDIGLQVRYEVSRVDAARYGVR